MLIWKKKMESYHKKSTIKFKCVLNDNGICKGWQDTILRFKKKWFQFINKIKKEGLPYRDEANPALKPFLVRIPQDVSSIQKSLNMGRACKACDLFCHMCACRSYAGQSQLFEWRKGHLRCKEYSLNQPNPSQKGFHWHVDDDEEIQKRSNSYGHF